MKNKFILLLLFIFVTMGLGACQKPIPEETYLPTSVEIVNLEDANEMTLGDNPLELMALVYPSGAKQAVTWSSSNPEVATVEDGFVSALSVGTTTIEVEVVEDSTLTSSLLITVYDDASDLETITGIINTLNTLIPTNITTDMTFPTRLQDATITWESSDYNSINRNGVVTRSRIDQEVTITGTITLARSEGEFHKTVMVKAYPLKDLSNRKVAFTYLFDPNFTGFREGDLDRIDVINYSFAGINNHRMSVNGLRNLATLVQDAHDKGVRVVVAIGGWGVDGFSQACSTPENRTIFISSIMETIQRYRLDGIDIDWEYPTSTAGGLIASSPNDPTNLTYFMQGLRAAMDEVDPDLILSMAVAAGTYAASTYYNMAVLGNVIDYCHIMTYDMINYTSYSTTHHTNLYPSSYSTFSVSQAVNTYASNGVPKSKIVVGVAFYGHVFITTSTGTNGIGATSGKTGKTTYRYGSIVLNYLNNPAYTLYYDDVAKASWLYGEGVFISFDNPDSIAEKALYVHSEGLAGLMAWEYCQDDATSSLVKAIYDGIMN